MRKASPEMRTGLSNMRCSGRKTLTPARNSQTAWATVRCIARCAVCCDARGLQCTGVGALVRKLRAAACRNIWGWTLKPSLAPTPKRATSLYQPEVEKGAPRSEVNIKCEAGSCSCFRRRSARSSTPLKDQPSPCPRREGPPLGLRRIIIGQRGRCALPLVRASLVAARFPRCSTSSIVLGLGSFRLTSAPIRTIWASLTMLAKYRSGNFSRMSLQNLSALFLPIFLQIRDKGGR
jgi:hypothetical protein